MEREIILSDIAKIQKLLSEVLKEESYDKLERLGGLTNHTYKVTLQNGSGYCVRIPGDGTEELIIRQNEKKSTALACELGIDAQMIFFGDDGSKVMEYIPNAITMSEETLKDELHIQQMADIFRKLHTCGVDTGVPFEVFDMAVGYEKIIVNNRVPMYSDYEETKQRVMDIKRTVDSNIKIKNVPCHNDPLCENWVIGNGKMYLIDWEYAGMNDGMWDLADVSIEAGFDEKLDEKLLTAYRGKAPDALTWKHFYANKIYVDYLWTLWAKTRVPFDGQPMEDWAAERYMRLKMNIEKF